MSNDKILELRAKAEHGRRVLGFVSDDLTKANIESYIRDLEADAAKLEASASQQKPIAVAAATETDQPTEEALEDAGGKNGTSVQEPGVEAPAEKL